MKVEQINNDIYISGRVNRSSLGVS